MYTLEKNDLDFYQVSPMPGNEELQKYYSEKYYQAPVVKTYSLQYTHEELRFGMIAPEVADYIFSQDAERVEKTLYDIGCGEGFFMDSMQKLGWTVSGTDFSEAGIKNQNPHLYSNVTYRSALEDIQDRISKNEKFTMVNLGNILEHVTDPIVILKEVKNLVHKNGFLRIVVPNDSSEFQALIFDLKLSDNNWFVPPDHLSYFNFETLPGVLAHTGYETVRKLGDFPIELFLLNENGNYYKNKQTGPGAHFARVTASNFIHERG